MDRRERIVAGVAGLLVLAWFVPDLVGVLLMLFSALVFVIAMVGLLRPSLVRIPDRMAAVWAFALSVGLFIGGGMLLSPPNGESTASDMPLVTEQPADPCSLTAADFGEMSQEEQDRAWQVCLDAQGYGPEQEAAEHLRNAADCLDITRGDLLGVFDPDDTRPPQLVVDGILSACGLAFNEYTGLSPKAEALALDAIERVRWTLQGLAAYRTAADLDRSLGNVIAGFEGQADRLEE